MYDELCLYQNYEVEQIKASTPLKSNPFTNYAGHPIFFPQKTCGENGNCTDG